MKKIICVILLLVISTSIFALPGWNPWARTWTFYFNDECICLRFDRVGNVQDLETSQTYKYDWDTQILYIFDYNGHDYEFEITFSPYSKSEFTGVEVNLEFKIEGHTSN